MGLWNTYVNYIKDNPHGYWFKRKLYGWGWTPATWQGWLVLVVYAVALVFLLRNVDDGSMSASNVLIEMVIPIWILSAGVIIICYLKGEKPRWQWGDRDKQKDV